MEWSRGLWTTASKPTQNTPHAPRRRWRSTIVSIRANAISARPTGRPPLPPEPQPPLPTHHHRTRCRRRPRHQHRGQSSCHSTGASTVLPGFKEPSLANFDASRYGGSPEALFILVGTLPPKGLSTTLSPASNHSPRVLYSVLGSRF